MKLCALIPTYNHFDTIEAVIGDVRRAVDHVLVIDDGSAPHVAATLQEICARTGSSYLSHEKNGGKGAAVKSGLAEARARGFTHALQVDADGQHDLSALPEMIDSARANEDALVLAAPRFDGSAPTRRLMARRICIFWCNVETGGPVIEDPMCGLRVYPVERACLARARGMRMDFDPEIAVRMVWDGAPVVNVPVRVRYVRGALSNFQSVRDNLRISWMHARLMTLRCVRLFFGAFALRRTRAV